MKQITLLLSASVLIFVSKASLGADTLKTQGYYSKFQITGGNDGGIFSTAAVLKGPEGSTGSLTRLRYSWVLNVGVHFHYNFTKSVGIFAGPDIKNIGFIDRDGDYIIKRRTYTIGSPLGLKIGDMHKGGAYFFAGVGADMPFNYREKKFIARNNKTKFNEWFSDRTEKVLPYIFAGYKFTNDFSLKAQYYTGSYLNMDYTNNGIRPYANFDVHIMYLSVGYTIQYGKYTRWKGNWVKKAMI